MNPIYLNLPFFAEPVSLYGVLAVLFILVAMVISFLSSMASGLKKNRHMAVYTLLALVLGLFFGRLIYCAVMYNLMFFDAMGYFSGYGAFFNPFLGSLNMGGILIGVLLAAPLSALLAKEKAAAFADAAVLPGLLLYAGMRWIEPLSGQGYGDLVENPLFAFSPLCLVNDYGEWTLSVCFIEAVAALVLLIVLLFLRKKATRPGSLFLYAIALFAPTQMFAELFRQDDVLYILVFASVSLLCLVTVLVLSQFALLLRARKDGMKTSRAIGEGLLMLLGVIVCVGGVFALDKTNIPDLYIYIVMALALMGMVVLFCQRIAKEDKRKPIKA